MADRTSDKIPSPRTGKTGISPVTWAVFFLSWTLYYWLRTWDFYAVDGALRALDAMRADKVFFHGNNHMFYPVWFYLWGKLLNLVGTPETDPVALMRSAQTLNTLLSAGILACLHHLFRQMVGTSRALLGVGVFGLCNAFFKHATNSAEVIPGIFFGVLGLCWMVAGIRRDSIWRLGMSGAWLALAIGSYQSMGQLALVGIVLCCNLSGLATPARLPISTMISRLLWVGVGGTLGLCAVYGWAFHTQGVPWGQMVSRFFKMTEGSDAFFGFYLARALHLPLGYLSGWYKILPPDSTGIRDTITRWDAAIWIAWIATGALVVGIIAHRVGRGWWLMFRERGPIWFTTTIVAGVGLALPLLCWDPYYDKLLILPLLGSISIGLVVLGQPEKNKGQHSGRYGAVVGLLVLELISTVGFVIWEQKNPKTYLDDAKAVASIVRPDDWVVMEFNPVAAYFASMFLTNHERTMATPMLKKEEARAWLAHAKEQCRTGSGRLLFLGVLEMDRKHWDAFVGRIGGLPYDELSRERESARELARFKNGNEKIMLHEVPVRSAPLAQ